MARMHEVDFHIYGEDLQFVEVELDPGEAAVAEAGTLMYMEDGIEMETIFGDGSEKTSGFFGSLLGAGKRLLTGESLFTTVFLNKSGSGKRKVSFAAPYPGKIIPVNLSELGGELIAQKDSFLAAAKGVSLGIAFQKKLGTGLFGGEGFIMQRLQGDGLAFIHAGGTLHERTLGPDCSAKSAPPSRLPTRRTTPSGSSPSRCACWARSAPRSQTPSRRSGCPARGIRTTPTCDGPTATRTTPPRRRRRVARHGHRLRR